MPKTRSPFVYLRLNKVVREIQTGGAIAFDGLCVGPANEVSHVAATPDVADHTPIDVLNSVANGGKKTTINRTKDQKESEMIPGRRLSTFPIFVTIVCLLAGPLWAQSTVKERPFSRFKIARELAGMHGRLVEVCDALRVPGLAVTVVLNDQIVYLEGFGVRDPENHAPVTPDTVFFLAECTKPFVAAAVQLLAEEGKVALDAPVRTYLPRFEIADPTLTQSLTVQDLLCHAKGLESDPLVWLSTFTGEITEDRYARWLKKTRPALTHLYSDLHYMLAGRIIESVYGGSWKGFLTDRVFKPTGMTRSTCYADTMYALGNVAVPTVRTVDGFAHSAIRMTERTMSASGGMGASIRDLARWLRMNLNDGEIDGTRVLSKQSIAEMRVLRAVGGPRWPRYVNRISEGHGLGWVVGTYRGQRQFSHGGGHTGIAAHISFMPEKNLGVAVVANTDGAVAELIAMDVYDRMLGTRGEDLLPRFQAVFERRLERMEIGLTVFEKNPAADGGLSLPAKAYVGTYTNDDWGTIQLRLADGKLVGKMGDLSLHFGSDGIDRFIVDFGTGRPDKGRFAGVHGDRVSAVVLDLSHSAEPVRFQRR